MRSHHAPPKRLLQQFTFKDKGSRAGRAIYVYERDRTPRSSKDLAGECVEREYFAGATSGETDLDIDERFNNEYEAPFNRLLPAFASDLHVFSSAEVRAIAANYVAHLFRRSVAVRTASEKRSQQVIEEFKSIVDDQVRLRAHCAEASVVTRRTVSPSEMRDAILKRCEYQSSVRGQKARFVDDLDRATKQTSSQLQQLTWQTLKGTSGEAFFISDTPVVSKAIDPFQGVQYGRGIARAYSEWFLPISPRYVLRIGSSHRRSLLVRPEEVGDLNLGQVLTMSRRVYGNSMSPWIGDIVQRWGSNYKYFEDIFKAPRSTNP